MTLVALALLAGSAWTLGTLALRSWSWPELRWHERGSLEVTAGLGLVSLMLALLALSGLFFLATPLLILLTIAGAAIAMRRSKPPSESRTDPWWVRAVTVAMFACAAVACVSAITPVVDYDALSYVLPIANHIADTGRLRVWSDQARSMWPLSHEMLLAYVLRLGGQRLIAVTTLEWVACVGAVSALARRACAHASHVPVAVVIALASPVVAFQISTAKEDLLLVAATAATGFCLIGSDRRDLVAAGLFAGVAAGTKYPGLGVALAAVAWVAIHHRRVRPVIAAAGAAFAVGGLWYVLNLWRFGNPVAPFVFGVPGTPLDMRIVRDLLDSWGLRHRPLDFLITPIKLFLQPKPFLGLGALFNPLAYFGLAGLGVSSIRRRNLPLMFTAAVLYVGWFFSLENARLLLPAAVLLSPGAADVFVPIVSRWRPLAWASAVAVAVPLLFIPLVGVIRVVRYARDPAGYLNDNTQHYADLVWANTHLDPQTNRILSFYPDVGYLKIPYLPTAPTYQMEMSYDEIEDPALFLNACRRQGITHLYAGAPAFRAIASHLRLVHDNPQSLLGGEHFFRASGTDHTELFEILR